MNDELKQMVEEASLGFLLGDNWMLHHELEYFAKLVEAKKETEMQERIEKLYTMYEQASRQRDELMDQQRATVAAMRGQLQ